MDKGTNSAYVADPMVVAMPQEIDMQNAPQVGRQLGLALVAGAVMVIADFSVTTFCDSSGVRELALVHRHASDMGAELRLAAPSGGVLRVMELAGLDKLVPVFDSLAAARGELAATETPRAQNAR